MQAPETTTEQFPPATLSDADRLAISRLSTSQDERSHTPSPGDIAEVNWQLGRTPRGIVGISARCACGRPLAVKTAPRLPDGTPFPTLFYLTHPALTAAASTLEAAGVMKEMTARLEADARLAAAYGAAHRAYLAEREALGDVPEIAGISAGGMPTRVKCLHVLFAHALSAGPGINPLGDEALAMAIRARLYDPARCQCVARPHSDAESA